MQTMLATNVRNNFSSVIDTVLREKPVMFKRNRDNIMLLSEKQLLGLVQHCSFKAVFYNEENGTVTAGLEGFDLVVNSPDQEMVLTDLANELIEYAQDYINEFQLYYNSKNRKLHFPYVLRVLLAQDMDEVKGLIHA
jgi:hypothetical protein